MYRVRRTRLDNTAPAVARTTANHTEIVLDERDISPAGASALERLLNAITAPHHGADTSEPRCPQQPKPGNGKRRG